MKELIVLDNKQALWGKVVLGVHLPYIYDRDRGCPTHDAVSYIAVKEKTSRDVVLVYPVYFDIDMSGDDYDISNMTVSEDEFLESLVNDIQAETAFKTITKCSDDEFNCLVKKPLQKKEEEAKITEKNWDIQRYKSMKNSMDNLKIKYPDIEKEIN